MAASASVLKDQKSESMLTAVLQLKGCLEGLVNTTLTEDQINAKLASCDYSNLQEFIDFIDLDGNTILHCAAATGSLCCVKFITDKLGVSASHKLSLVTNNIGFNALNVVLKLPNSISLMQDLLKYLLALTADASVKNINSLSMVLDEKEIPKKFPEVLSNGKLHSVISYAYKITNQCRAYIKESESHPYVNWLSDKEYLENRKKMFSLRRSLQLKSTKNSELVDAIRKAGIANCGEFADMISYHVASSQNPIIFNIERAYLDSNKGDHAFTVINRNVSSDEQKPLSWGDTATVIDAWAGNVYPAKYLFKELMAFKSHCCGDRPIVTIATYNPKYHTLKFINQNACQNDTTYLPEPRGYPIEFYEDYKKAEEQKRIEQQSNTLLVIQSLSRVLSPTAHSQKDINISLTPVMEVWREQFKLNPKSFAQRFEELKLTDEEKKQHQQILSTFLDPVSNKIINIPVIYEGRIYNLDTLIAQKNAVHQAQPHEKTKQAMDCFLTQIIENRRKNPILSIVDTALFAFKLGSCGKKRSGEDSKSSLSGDNAPKKVKHC